MHHIYVKIRQHEDLWDLYTRKEEYTPQQLDQYGCFIPDYSSRQEILEPSVSRFLKGEGLNIAYPDNKQFAVCLTHDVDEIYPPLTHTLLSTMTSLKGLDIKGLKRQAFWKLNGKERSPYWNFQEIMDLEEKYSARSSFYFLATNADIRRFRYNIEDLEGELDKIVDRGWEVGLHGGYYAYNNLTQILIEKERLERVLGRKVTGYRNHYLRFKVPDSWEILVKAGFEYDTTLGYNDIVGFRNGMCHPFRPYNLRTDRESNILEIPLAIMDNTLFESVRSYDEGVALIKRVVDTVKLYKGVLCVNWHSNSLNCPFKQKWDILYKFLLDYCYKRGAWMTSGERICTWWNLHEY